MLKKSLIVAAVISGLSAWADSKTPSCPQGVVDATVRGSYLGLIHVGGSEALVETTFELSDTSLSVTAPDGSGSTMTYRMSAWTCKKDGVLILSLYFANGREDTYENNIIMQSGDTLVSIGELMGDDAVPANVRLIEFLNKPHVDERLVLRRK